MATQKGPGARSNLDPRLADEIRRAFSGDQSEAADALRILERHDPRFVGRISDEMRRVADDNLHRALGWRVLRNSSVISTFLKTLPEPSGLAALAITTSSNGYAREAAVRTADFLSGPFSLALLVNRLNDWVPNVRQAAEARLKLLFLDPELVADCIEYLWQFDDFGRASAVGYEIVAVMIGSDAVATSLQASILHGADDRSVRLVRHLLRSPALDDVLVQLATHHKHPRVRAIAAKTALEQVFSWRTRTLQKRAVFASFDRNKLARALLKDRSADVQHIALQHLAQNIDDRPALEALLKRYLTHPRGKLTELAQWRLGKLDVDWLAWLRSEFDRRPNASLARALARAGAAADGRRIWAFAQHEAGEAHFILALAAARLGQPEAIQLCRRIALGDEDLRHARMASSALLDAHEPISFQELADAAEKPELFVKRGLLAHVRKLSIVRQLSIFAHLERAGSPPEPVEFAGLYRRLNRGKFDPAETELNELREQAADCPRVTGWMRRLHLS